jgi:hypothetical protein
MSKPGTPAQRAALARALRMHRAFEHSAFYLLMVQGLPREHPDVKRLGEHHLPLMARIQAMRAGLAK